jgi:hypothetical protein
MNREFSIGGSDVLDGFAVSMELNNEYGIQYWGFRCS